MVPTHTIAGALVESEGEHGPMRQTVRRAKDFPFAVLVEAEAVLGARPDALAIDQDAEHMVVGQAVGSGEVLPAEHAAVSG